MVSYHCRNCGSKEISLCGLNPNEDGIEAVDNLNDYHSPIWCDDCGEDNKCWEEREVCK